MALVYEVQIKTESGHDWEKIRQIFDGVNSPMTEPYSYKIKRSDKYIPSGMPVVDCNRDRDFIKEYSQKD